MINAISSAGIIGNNNFASVSEAASDAKFAQMLKDVQRKAAAAENKHVVSEKAKSKADAKLKEACKGFEAMFLNMMYREMRATVPKDEFFGESNAMNIFKDMRDTELTKKIAEGGGIGLGDLLYRQLAPTVLAQEEAMAKSASAVEQKS